MDEKQMETSLSGLGTKLVRHAFTFTLPLTATDNPAFYKKTDRLWLLSTCQFLCLGKSRRKSHLGIRKHEILKLLGLTLASLRFVKT